MDLSEYEIYYLLEVLNAKEKDVEESIEHDDNLAMTYKDKNMREGVRKRLENYEDELRIITDLKYKVSDLLK